MSHLIGQEAGLAHPTVCTGGPGAPLRQSSDATAGAGTFHFCNGAINPAAVSAAPAALAIPAAIFLASSLVIRLLPHVYPAQIEIDISHRRSIVVLTMKQALLVSSAVPGAGKRRDPGITFLWSTKASQVG